MNTEEKEHKIHVIDLAKLMRLGVIDKEEGKVIALRILNRKQNEGKLDLDDVRYLVEGEILTREEAKNFLQTIKFV